MASTGKSAPTLSRRLLALEQATGQELFIRMARGYELTLEGKALMQRVLSIESQIAHFDRTETPQPKSTGQGFRRQLDDASLDASGRPPRARQPTIAAALYRRRAAAGHQPPRTTIGLRNNRPEQAEIACRRTGQVQFAVYAKNKSVRRWARVLGETPTACWVAERANDDETIELSAPRNALDLASSGMAKAVLPTFIGKRAPRLQMIGAVIPELSHEQWLVTHQDERYRPEVRLCIDRIYAACQLILAK